MCGDTQGFDSSSWALLPCCAACCGHCCCHGLAAVACQRAAECCVDTHKGLTLSLWRCCRAQPHAAQTAAATVWRRSQAHSGRVCEHTRLHAWSLGRRLWFSQKPCPYVPLHAVSRQKLHPCCNGLRGHALSSTLGKDLGWRTCCLHWGCKRSQPAQHTTITTAGVSRAGART